MNQLDERALHQHVSILGWLHIIGNALFLVVGFFVFALLLSVGAWTGDAEAMGILSVVGVLVGSLLVLLGLPGIVAGVGLLRRRNWGRILALVVGILGLVNIPVGTAIGIYTIWVLLQESAPDYFQSQSAGVG